MIFVMEDGGIHAKLTTSEKDKIRSTILGSKLSESKDLAIPIPEFEVPFVAFMMIDREFYAISQTVVGGRYYVNCKYKAIDLLVRENTNVYYTLNAFNRLRQCPTMVSLLLRKGILSN